MPPNVVKSEDLERKFNLPYGWIKKRTGIEERRFISKGQTLTELALYASLDALKSADLKPQQLDLIIFASTSRDRTIPTSSAILQNKLKAYGSVTIDVNSICLGFLNALDIANLYIKAGIYRRVLVVALAQAIKNNKIKRGDKVMLVATGAGFSYGGIVFIY